jgi:hypothetical protein
LLFQDGSNGEVVPLPEEASGKGQIRYPCAGARETANATANTQSMNFRLKLFINKSVWCRSYAFPALGLFYFNYLSAILIFFPLTGAWLPVPTRLAGGWQPCIVIPFYLIPNNHPTSLGRDNKSIINSGIWPGVEKMKHYGIIPIYPARISLLIAPTIYFTVAAA